MRYGRRRRRIGNAPADDAACTGARKVRKSACHAQIHFVSYSRHGSAYQTTQLGDGFHAIHDLLKDEAF
jgi:hypothetical protein